MSEFTEKKAQNIVDTKSIIQIDNSTYQVKASTTGKSYIIDEGICEYKGFRYRKTCSHVQAANLLKQKTAETTQCL